MLTLSEVKLWLRLEPSEDAEDALLQSLIDQAEERVRGMVWRELWQAVQDSAGEPAAERVSRIIRLLMLVLVADLYEHRGVVAEVRYATQAAGPRPTVQALVAQLQHAYPPPPGAPQRLSPGSSDPAAPAAVDAPVSVSWAHVHPECAAQEAYQVLVEPAAGGAAVYDSGKVVSRDGAHTVPDGTLAPGTPYRWRVRTKDARSGLWGPYSDPAYIVVAG